ncbi:cellular nucleic acid-binding protein homolog [Lathyrus oleraceus]|uniref:cellular nucleic acid-binding protein homolog n=1 Tax=Pisum sativum TaxID=3888 RepID=UPI0021CF544C|nr:cellular nucleic acid-binding protein homolog [Pisum sativum]
MASSCPNEGICHTCGKTGHRARACSAPAIPPGDLRLCHNCYKLGHIAVECMNEKACNNCRKTGHLARDCPNDPICNVCNVSGHRGGGGLDRLKDDLGCGCDVDRRRQWLIV